MRAFLQDSWHGVYPRWHVSFNITMLRLVSFSIDHHWACSHTGTADVGHPSRARVSWWLTPRVTTAWGRAQRQETPGRVPPSRHVHLPEFSRLRALRAALYRGAHNHLQRFHVAGARNK